MIFHLKFQILFSLLIRDNFQYWFFHRSLITKWRGCGGHGMSTLPTRPYFIILVNKAGYRLAPALDSIFDKTSDICVVSFLMLILGQEIEQWSLTKAPRSNPTTNIPHPRKWHHSFKRLPLVVHRPRINDVIRMFHFHWLFHYSMFKSCDHFCVRCILTMYVAFTWCLESEQTRPAHTSKFWINNNKKLLSQVIYPELLFGINLASFKN